jgi:hypothetical protein
MIDWSWKKSNAVSRSGLLGWHQHEKNVSQDGLILDYSGNGRNLTAETDAPVLTPNVQNGQPGWLFNGAATNPLVWAGGDIAPRHIFIVMAFTEAELSGTFQGVLSGVNTFDALTGIGGTDRFFDFGFSGWQYRKGGKFYVLSNQKAPVGGAVAVIELISPDPIFLDGIQIGQQRNLTARRGKFYFFESLFYEHIKTGCERQEIFEHFAERYHIWRYRSDDLAIFPFAFDRSTEHNEEELAEISEAEGERARDRIVRYLNDADEPFQSYNFTFADRFQREWQASRMFLRQHRLHLPFWVEDIERDQFTKITQEKTGKPSTGTAAFRFNYEFQGRIYDYSAVTDEPLPIEVVGSGLKIFGDSPKVGSSVSIADIIGGE